jgi:hypothetical protein
VLLERGRLSKAYSVKNFDWKHSVPSKRTGCPCQLTVKTYPDTKEVLGMYSKGHAHKTGDDNLKFTWLSKEVRDKIVDML